METFKQYTIKGLTSQWGRRSDIPPSDWGMNGNKFSSSKDNTHTEREDTHKE